MYTNNAFAHKTQTSSQISSRNGPNISGNSYICTKMPNFPEEKHAIIGPPI